MSTNPLFLQRLNLDETADERAIRRAYARELKQIDQERNPAEFQELRESYEDALLWARMEIALAHADTVDDTVDITASSSALESISESAPAAEAFDDEDAVAIAAVSASAAAPKVAPQEELEIMLTVNHEKIDQELEEFRLFSDGMRRRDEPVGDLVSWQEKLSEMLSRPEFDSLHARGMFEANIVYRLVNGWKPGHETLFVAAAQVFHWKEEPNRLRAFGEGGEIIDLAVLQYLMFEELRGTPQYSHFRKAVARLRIDKAPSFSELIELYPYMEALAENYPTWLSVITDVQRLEVWRNKDKEIPAWRRKYCNFAALKRISIFPKMIANWHWAARIFLLYIVAAVLINLFSSGSKPPKTAARPSPSADQIPVNKELQPRIPSSAELVRQGNSSTATSPPSIVWVKPNYPSLSLLRQEEGQVMVRVLINVLGKADEVEITKSSGFPRLDEAALEAAKHGSYKPYIEAGTPMPSYATLPISFSLADYKK